MKLTGTKTVQRSNYLKLTLLYCLLVIRQIAITTNKCTCVANCLKKCCIRLKRSGLLENE